MGYRTGASKRQRGGRGIVGKRPTKIVVCDFDVLNVSLNVYQGLSAYIELRRMTQINSNCFFLRPQARASG